MGSLFGFASLFCQLAGSILHFPVSRTYFLFFCTSAAKNIRIKSLIEAKDVDALATAMNGTTKVTLRQMNLGIKDMKNIATALHGNTTITSLNLVSNNISDDGAKEIATALGTNKFITTLNLTDNDIGDDGALALADMLLTNKTLMDIKGANYFESTLAAHADS